MLPVLVPLVITAVVLGIAFAQLFPAAATRPAPVAHFTDISASSGLDVPPAPGENTTPTTLGGAVVVFDYDNDGRPDLFFVNGAPWPWEESFAKQPGRGSCALFHNDGNGHFTDVTSRAGLDVQLQGMSAAAGDFDNDGLVDLFVTCVGSNHLFRNRGDGRFDDVTDQAGVGGDEHTWSTGAAWVDVDGDGKPDLVVAHYARWSAEVGLERAFTVARVGRSYGMPIGFISAYPSVYRNLGDGRFALVPGSAGLRDTDPQTGLPVARALAVAPVDVNGDGRLDLLFSYLDSPAALFVNQRDGTFRKWDARRSDRHEGVAALAAASAPPLAEWSDPRLKAFEAATLAVGPGTDGLAHLAAKLGIAPLDYDLMGDVAFFSGEGVAEPDTDQFEATRRFARVPALFWHDGAVWKRARIATPNRNNWSRPIVARGIAVADFDGDGDPDVVIARRDGPPMLLRNDQRQGFPWLRVRLIATRTAEEAGGARVEVQTPRRTWVRTVEPAMGFMAQSESTLTFGLGEDARVRAVVVKWPSGQRQVVASPAIDRTLIIREPR